MQTESGAYPTTMQGTEAFKDFADRARKQLNDGMEQMSETLAEHATTALLVAAGVGFLLGAMLAMGRR